MSMKREATASLQRVAMFSVHSCPLATLGGRETGGMNVYVRELSRQLSQHGIAVDVYTRRQDPCLPTVVDFAPHARVIHLNAGPAAPYEKHQVWRHLPEFVEGVQRFVAGHTLCYEVLHSHYWFSGWVALQLQRSWQVPMVHMSHTLGAAKNAAAQQPWEHEPPRRLRIEREILQRSDVVIAESPASKQHMSQVYDVDSGKIEIIPGGVDIATFRPQDRQQIRQSLGLAPEQPVLLFVGRLQPLKGIDILLRAAQIVQQQYPSLQVLVIGGGVDIQDDHETQERQRLQALSQELGLACRVQFIKAQPQEILVQYYAAADVFVMPSHYESFGMVVLEAMACGTPVVASNVGGLTSTVVHGSTGLLVPAGDWHAFAQAIVRLIASPLLRERYGQASVQRAQRFAWPGIVARTIQLYRRLLRRDETVSRQHASVMPCPL
jgi:D-inositol-3-phosphate glycosyltransferase